MRKLFLLLALIGWLISPSYAQISDPNELPLLDTEIFLLPIIITTNNSTQKCYLMEFAYKCPSGNCKLGIYKQGGFDNISNTGGVPNTNWKFYSGTVCFDKQNKPYESKIYCQVDVMLDGAVVVIEGGG